MSTATLAKPAKATAQTEWVDEFAGGSAPLTHNAESHIISGVKLVGKVSSNGRRYPDSTLRAAKDKYEGARVFVNHSAKEAVRGYESLIGHVTNPQLRNDGIYGDLRYNPKHALAEMLAWDASHAPHKVGFSHVVLGQLRTENNVQVVDHIEQVKSVDLVTDPATTHGLFEGADDGGEIKESETMPTFNEILADANLAKQLKEHFAAGDAERQKIADLEKTATDNAAALKEANDKLATIEAENKKVKAREAADAMFKEHKLPEKAIDELLREAVANEPDESKKKKLVEDRKKMFDGIPLDRRSGGATSKEIGEAGGGAGAPSDAKSFAHSITG